VVLTVAPTHQKIPNIHYYRIPQWRGFDELSGDVLILNLQATTVILKKHRYGTPI
jgi:hypothetical protein